MRLLLVPLMMLCAAPRNHPVLTNEAWSVIASLGLGLSNGYFGSVPMITAPSRVADHQKELTGMPTLPTESVCRSAVGILSPAKTQPA